MSSRDTLVRRAEVSAAAGDLTSAIALYCEVVATNPRDTAAAIRLGDLLAASGHIEDAVTVFLEASAAYQRAGSWVKAIAAYKKLIKLDPTRLDVYESLAGIYARLGLSTEALAQLKVLAEYYERHGERQHVERLQAERRTILSRLRSPAAAITVPQVPDLPVAGAGVAPVRTSSDLVIFLCHASEDKPIVRELYQKLKGELLQPWLDEEDLLPGQRWEEEIKKAVRRSHVVVVCLSKRSTTKAGFVHKEIKFALDILEEQPEGVIYVIPARLEDCSVPDSLCMFHYVDLFRPGGYPRLRQAINTRSLQLGFSPLPNA